MHADAVRDAEPAGLDRVVRRAAGDDLAGEAACPGRVGHVPGRVDGLVLDLVEARRGLQADLADGDRVALHALELAEEADAKAAAVDGQDRRVPRGELVAGDLR